MAGSNDADWALSYSLEFFISGSASSSLIVIYTSLVIAGTFQRKLIGYLYTVRLWRA